MPWCIPGTSRDPDRPPDSVLAGVPPPRGRRPRAMEQDRHRSICTRHVGQAHRDIALRTMTRHTRQVCVSYARWVNEGAALRVRLNG